MITNLRTLSIVGGFLVSATCMAFAQDAKPVSGGTLVIAVGGEMQTLNPAITQGAGETVIGCMMHDGMVEIDGNGELVPSLAKSWSVSSDGLTYTFDLVAANWHDGKPFTAKDVAFSLQNVNAKFAPLFSAQVGKRIVAIDVIDDRRVSIKLTEPFGPFLRMLTCYNGGAIVPEHVYKGGTPTTNPASNAPVGTGPFKFVDWRSGDSIRLAKNPNYWQAGKPYLDGIIIRSMPNAGSRVRAMLAGEADYIQRYYLPVNDIASIRNSPALKIQASSQPPNAFIGFFNLKSKPFDDKKVRQVLFSLVDRKFIQQAAFSGQGEAAQAPFPTKIVWAADPAINFDKLYPANVAAANAALDSLGLKRDSSGVRFRTNITFESSIPERLKAATAIQSAWKAVGVEVEIRPLERAVLLPRVFTNSDFGVFLHSYGSYGDPALGLARIFLTSMIGREFGNAAGYSNPAVDKLFEEAASLSDTKARGDLYRKIQNILADELPVMTLHENTGVDAASAKLNGLWGYEGPGRWADAWLAK